MCKLGSSGSFSGLPTKKNIPKDCHIEDSLLSVGLLLRFLWLRLRKKEVRVAKELNVQNYMSS